MRGWGVCSAQCLYVGKKSFKPSDVTQEVTDSVREAAHGGAAGRLHMLLTVVVPVWCNRHMPFRPSQDVWGQVGAGGTAFLLPAVGSWYAC